MRPRKQQRHLPSCVYQRHGAYYLVKAGKWTRLGADLSAALAEYGRLQGQATGGMQELIETALPHITKGKAQATQDQYGVAARKLQGILADFSPQQVMPKHVAQMRRALADTPNMANRCITVLRLVFDYAVEEQLVDSNPCTGIKRLEEAKRDRLVLHDEFERIHEKAPPRLQLMMELAYLTGQRLMDVVGIHRTELKDDGIYFRQDKTNAQLVVRWTPQIRDVVERAKRLGGKVEGVWLFRSRHGKPPAYGTVRDQWIKACTDAGIPDTTLRDLRAMSATATRKQGKDATALLGHASPAMTRRYLRDREVPLVDGPVLDSIGQSAVEG